MPEMSGRNSILVSMQDPSARERVLDRLSLQGYRVLTAERGTDALLAVAEDAAKLVILDLAIQEPSGIRTVEVLRKIRPHLPLIVLSGDHSVETGRQVLQHGPLHYLLTPMNLDELDQIVQIALASSRRRPRAER